MVDFKLLVFIQPPSWHIQKGYKKDNIKVKNRGHKSRNKCARTHHEFHGQQQIKKNVEQIKS